MPVSKFALDSQGRPTLPPIHTLNISLPKHAYVNHDNLRCSPLNAPHNHHHDRQVSTSSSQTSASRTVSPSPPPSDTDSEVNHSNPHTSTKFRLVPCPLEMADAVILVPPPDATHITTAPNYVPRTGHGRGLLLVGPALHHVRQPERQLAKGARIHPYRVVRGENTQSSRRSSIISITSFSHAV
ncbi:hypothetical protein BYT27DRAFT_7230448 [Phlegmacium glaucopus]|nr:hypothetical protein BYT27DRAFT_7230448 [Phlegmacium glaucopus]